MHKQSRPPPPEGSIKPPPPPAPPPRRDAADLTWPAVGRVGLRAIALCWPDGRPFTREELDRVVVTVAPDGVARIS